MYLRFVTGIIDPDSGSTRGFFWGVHFYLDRLLLTRCEWEDWLWTELDAQYGWFVEHLDEPERFRYRPSRRNGRTGVCWFRAEAVEHIEHARYTCWLLQQAGLHTMLLRRRDPGQVVWEDDHQIVALAA